MDVVLNRVLAVLSTTIDRWQSLARDLPPEMLAEPPAAGSWSALECLLHLIDTEPVFQSRLAAFRAGRDFPAFNPDKEGSRLGAASAAELVAKFADLRQQSLALLESVTPDEYNLRANHSELGPVTLGEMINEWAAHDLNHTVQAERAVMQPFIRACGSWRVYFTDHIIES